MNYSLVVNSSFKPFSYQEMLAPVLMATQAHQELENQYGELATKSNIWEEMANEQTDPYAYKMYKNYANNLKEQADKLAKEGLNASSRKDMLNMRARYAKEITPIEQAYAARQKQAEQQQQALLQDPTLMLSRKASTTSLDDYIRNPQLAYDTYSGKLITAQAAQAASALAKEMQTQPRKWRSILGNSYYETMMQRGFSSQAVLQAIQDNPNAAPQLTKIIEDAVNSSGVRNWGDQATIARAIDYAKQGLWSAVGETQYQTLDNWRAKMAAQEAAQIRAENRAAARKAEEERQARRNGFNLNPSNIYSSRERDKEEKKYNDALKKYSQYFYKENGQWKMNQAGWNAYNEKKDRWVSANGAGSYRVKGDSDFKIFIDNLGGKGAISSVSFGPNQRVNIGRLWGRYTENSPEAKTAKYDAMKATEYKYNVPASEEYQNNFKSKLSGAIGSSGELVEVDYDAKSNTWVPTGNTLSFKDFDTKEYKLTSRASSEIGTTWFIKKDGEKAKRYRAVPGIHTTAEGGRDEALKQMIATQRMLQNPNLTPQQRIKLEDYYDTLTQQQHMFESQIDVTNQTSTQNNNPYYIP